MNDNKQNLYDQNTEFEILKLLIPHLDNKTFLDIGAEKGTFAQFLIEKNFDGVIFEPLPKHHEYLEKIIKNTASKFYNCAIDIKDGEKDFYVACDENGNVLDYFHSLQKLTNDLRVNHQQKITVTCRSLESLLAKNEIPSRIGILKTDTEGNDLNVLQSMGELKAEIIICEFFTKGLYAGWEQADPQGLIDEAKKKGFDKYIAVQRKNGNESVSFKPEYFEDCEWGNLIFISDELYEKSVTDLQKIFIQSNNALIGNTTLEKWLHNFMRMFFSQDKKNILIDVGSYHGAFTKQLLNKFEKAILFEPNPQNADVIRSKFENQKNVCIEMLAVGIDSRDVTFNYNNDLATGSVLAYKQSESEVRNISVKQMKLDDYAALNGIVERVGMIKIDTQGNDLNVLKSAEKILKESHPCLVVEFIYVPLYENQSSPWEISNWLIERGYSLARIFNEHYTAEGFIAFADAVFIPQHFVEKFQAPFYASPNSHDLACENKMLRRTCEERLELINSLHEEAEKRLQIIQKLQRK